MLYVAYATSNILPSLSDATWEYSLWGIEVAGPTFIKLTQWASTRSDLFSAEFCLRFARLQDATRGHAWKDTEITLKKEFGDDWQDKLTLDKSRVPIGSGCIAQVYHGFLKEAGGPHGLRKAGQEVAVKIVHPHVREKVEMDFYIMDKVTKFLEGLPRLNLEFLSLSDSVEQFRQVMVGWKKKKKKKRKKKRAHSRHFAHPPSSLLFSSFPTIFSPLFFISFQVPQLDLRCEAQNLERFRLNFASTKEISFPEPFNDFVTENVLVEGYVKGDRILSYLSPEAEQKDKQLLATLGVETVMNMIFMHDFVHGDLHPGNILVTRDKDGVSFVFVSFERLWRFSEQMRLQINKLTQNHSLTHSLTLFSLLSLFSSFFLSSRTSA